MMNKRGDFGIGMALLMVGMMIGMIIIGKQMMHGSHNEEPQTKESPASPTPQEQGHQH